MIKSYLTTSEKRLIAIVFDEKLRVRFNHYRQNGWVAFLTKQA